MNKFPHSFNINDMKIKHKLVLIIIAMSAIISIVTLLNYRYTIKEYNKLLYNQTANSLSFFSDELTYQLENMESVSSYIAYDSSFQKSLDTFNSMPFSSLTAQKSKNDILEIFNRYYTPDMVHITLISENERSLWWGKSALNESTDTLNVLLQSCDDANGRLIWRPSTNSANILCARRILQVNHLSLKSMGYLIIQIDLNDIVQSLLRSRYSNGQQFELFISSKERLIYSTDNENDLLSYQALSSTKDSYAIKKIGKSRMFITFSKLPLHSIDWNISLAVPYDDIFRSLNRLVPFFQCSLLLAILIAVVLSGKIVKNISFQFNTLMGKMNHIKQEGIMDLSATSALPIDSQDEITILNTYFDQMVIELRQLIEESYIKQLLIAQSELKSLEQQVNPHFLYNTINTINWLAKKAGVKDISIIADSLSNLLHNSLNNGQTLIPLQTELDIVTSYITIQQIRFEDLVVDTNIDYTILQTIIPKMAIQPLIENAIFYSQEEVQEQYLIRLTIQRRIASVFIQIENSGSKIDEDILEHIKNQTVKPKGNGISLLNIDSRLRILYGDSYHLNFTNINDMAVVWFEIPIN